MLIRGRISIRGIANSVGIDKVLFHGVKTEPFRRDISNMATTESLKIMVQPPWIHPKVMGNEELPSLRVYNSLTRQKEMFIPINHDKNFVKWYACGPTVYDDAHLGHARNYICTDVIRRILQNYFGFSVMFVMNITDIDDKIILRSRQQHLFANFTRQFHCLTPELIKEAKAALSAYVKRYLPLIMIPVELVDNDYDFLTAKIQGYRITEEIGSDEHVKAQVILNAALTASKAIDEASILSGGTNLDKFFEKTEDVFLFYLDSLHARTIKPNDYSIFERLTNKYEKRFFEDMDALMVERPDKVTRVSEYCEKIVKYVEKIIENGFAYVTNDGSVYFNIETFEKAGNFYAKLEPWNKFDKGLQGEGEGALSNKRREDKVNEGDFALWKASKEGEPAWKSPWGAGRPGWHIECSVMASDVLGERIDIHSGGIDLAFPHHDNEIAQSEAYWAHSENCLKDYQWVNYFLHMGHLSIQGSKMSKSLKNFTTIRAALSEGQWTARLLRIVFLMGGWKDGIELTDELITAAKAWEEKVGNFFFRYVDLSDGESCIQAEDQKLKKEFEECQSKIDEALKDSFNTGATMRLLSRLIGEANSHVNLVNELSPTLTDIAKYVGKIVWIFGLKGKKEKDTIGWDDTLLNKEQKWIGHLISGWRDELRKTLKENDFDDKVEKEMRSKYEEVDKALSSNLDGNEEFRVATKKLREGYEKALENKEKGKKINLLKYCDMIRDEILWDLGIFVEDREKRRGLIRPVIKKDIYLKEQREMREKEKKNVKEAEREKLEEKKQNIIEKGKIRAEDMFRQPEWTEWDDEGIPTKDKEGNEVAKAKRKRMKKEWERQKLLNEKYQKSQGFQAK